MKQEYKIEKIDKKLASTILLKYHYLKEYSKSFKSGHNYGLFKNNILYGVCIFTCFPVPELVVGMFNLKREEQQGMFELSRLCIHPEIQNQEHNIASWFVAHCIKILRQETRVRCILSYADSSFHNGTVYQALNFKYYGLSEKKSDFYIKQANGTYIKHSRGKTKGIEGYWRERARKHRYVLIYDKNLQINWREQEFPKKTNNE
jgi:hypothetical protein